MLKKIQLLQETSGLGLLFFNCVGQLKSNYRVYHKSVISPKRQVYNQAQGTFFYCLLCLVIFLQDDFSLDVLLDLLHHSYSENVRLC